MAWRIFSFTRLGVSEVRMEYISRSSSMVSILMTENIGFHPLLLLFISPLMPVSSFYTRNSLILGK